MFVYLVSGAEQLFVSHMDALCYSRRQGCFQTYTANANVLYQTLPGAVPVKCSCLNQETGLITGSLIDVTLPNFKCKVYKNVSEPEC